MMSRESQNSKRKAVAWLYILGGSYRSLSVPVKLGRFDWLVRLTRGWGRQKCFLGNT